MHGVKALCLTIWAFRALIPWESAFCASFQEPAKLEYVLVLLAGRRVCDIRTPTTGERTEVEFGKPALVQIERFEKLKRAGDDLASKEKFHRYKAGVGKEEVYSSPHYPEMRL